MCGSGAAQCPRWNALDRSSILVASMSTWFVYLIRTADDRLYTGITTDVAERLLTHSRGRGAKFLRGRGPLELAYRCRIGDRSSAQRVEMRLKRLTRADKDAIVSTKPTRARLFRRLCAEDWD